MSDTMRTPLKTTTGLGAAKEGTGHFIRQRVTAVALLILVPWFLFSLVSAYELGYAGAREWVSAPINAVLLIALMSAAFYHMRLGLQVVIEDYIYAHLPRVFLLILNTLLAALLWVAGVFSVLKVALGA